MKQLKVSITTFGCQMNEYDSEVVKTALEKQGYVLTDAEEKTLNEFHVINRAVNRINLEIEPTFKK